MKNSLVLLCLLFLVNGSVLAQKTAVLRGTIRDSATHEALPGVSVYLPELQTGAVTNTEGNYEPISARCAPGSGELLTETAIKLLNEIKKD